MVLEATNINRKATKGVINQISMAVLGRATENRGWEMVVESRHFKISFKVISLGRVVILPLMVANSKPKTQTRWALSPKTTVAKVHSLLEITNKNLVLVSSNLKIQTRLNSNHRALSHLIKVKIEHIFSIKKEIKVRRLWDNNKPGLVKEGWASRTVSGPRDKAPNSRLAPSTGNHKTISAVSPWLTLKTSLSKAMAINSNFKTTEIVRTREESSSEAVVVFKEEEGSGRVEMATGSVASSSSSSRLGCITSRLLALIR